MDATANFERTLAAHEVGPLVRGPATTLQVNVGKRCNQACHHCHVEAGPQRREMMTDEVAKRVLTLLASSPGVELLDLTGGPPEYAQPERLAHVDHPAGACLPPAQAELATRHGEDLRGRCGLEFHPLLTPTNLPISRFAAALAREGRRAAYMSLLVSHFNPAT